MKVKPKTNKSGKEIIVSLDQLEIDKALNVTEPEKLDELVASIKVMGVKHRIQVRRQIGSDTLFIIDGRTRFLAAKKAGLSTIAAIDNGYLNTVDTVTLAHVENWQRRKSNKKECLNSCRLLKQEGLANKEIAERLFLGKSTVSEYLSVLKAKPKVREAIGKGKANGGLTIKDAVKVSKLNPKEQELEVEKRVREAVERTREAMLPAINADLKTTPKLSQSMGVLMPGESLAKQYTLVSDYRERCQRLDIEVQNRLRQTPSNAKLQGMNLAIGVLRGKLSVDDALTNWDGI